MLDPTQAPRGKHTTYAWHVMPYPDSAARRRDFKAEFSEKIIETWERYAPNMTRENIIGRMPIPPSTMCRASRHARRRHLHGRVQRRPGDVRPFWLSHAIDLYMAGSAAHPGGAISGAAATSRRADRRDLGLEPWWKLWDAAGALSAAPAAA